RQSRRLVHVGPGLPPHGGASDHAVDAAVPRLSVVAATRRGRPGGATALERRRARLSEGAAPSACATRTPFGPWPNVASGGQDRGSRIRVQRRAFSHFCGTGGPPGTGRSAVAERRCSTSTRSHRRNLEIDTRVTGSSGSRFPPGRSAARLGASHGG